MLGDYATGLDISCDNVTYKSMKIFLTSHIKYKFFLKPKW